MGPRVLINGIWYKAVKDKRFLVVPGAHDALSARLIQTIGFETYFIGGFPAVGARADQG